MTAPTPVVSVYFDLSEGDSTGFFTFDEGEWDDPAEVWAGDTETDISEFARSFTIVRGRDRVTEDMQTGSATVEVNNYDRTFDPLHIAGEFYGNIQPGKRIRIRAGDVSVFDGDVYDYDYDYGVNVVSTAQIVAYDKMAALAQKDLDGFTGTVSQTTGQRLIDVLSRAEVNMAEDAQIDDGVSTLQADVIPDQTNALAYSHLVARSDLGRFFAARDRPLTFRDRDSVLVESGTVFADEDTYSSGALLTELGEYLTTETGDKIVTEDNVDTAAINFHGVGIGFGSDVLFTRVVVSRVGGSIETFSDVDAEAEYGIISTQDAYTDLLLEDDSQSVALGTLLIGQYATPTHQFSRLVVNLADFTAEQQAEVLSLELGDLVRCVFTPDGVGGPIDRLCIVEKIEHDVAPLRWVTTFLLSPGE